MASYNYKWSIETIFLSRMVAEILRVKHSAMNISIENACRDCHFEG